MVVLSRANARARPPSGASGLEERIGLGLVLGLNFC